MYKGIIYITLFVIVTSELANSVRIIVRLTKDKV